MMISIQNYVDQPDDTQLQMLIGLINWLTWLVRRKCMFLFHKLSIICQIKTDIHNLHLVKDRCKFIYIIIITPFKTSISPDTKTHEIQTVRPRTSWKKQIFSREIYISCRIWQITSLVGIPVRKTKSWYWSYSESFKFFKVTDNDMLSFVWEQLWNIFDFSGNLPCTTAIPFSLKCQQWMVSSK
jgi:hypothetical protein